MFSDIGEVKKKLLVFRKCGLKTLLKSNIVCEMQAVSKLLIHNVQYHTKRYLILKLFFARWPLVQLSVKMNKQSDPTLLQES